MTGRKRRGLPVHGWFILDKPLRMTSAQAVGRVRRYFNATKAGHAGTLDPLATGILPIAIGEATKAIFAPMNGSKSYHFTICWGEERDTDDAEGRIVRKSQKRPTADKIREVLPIFTGLIKQVPPIFSAVKVEGMRAYELARSGEAPSLKARQVSIQELTLKKIPDKDHALVEIICGKGTYIRSLARDIGRYLGCFGYVSELRRISVGPFDESVANVLEKLGNMGHKRALDELLLPVEAALADIPAVPVTGFEAERLRFGQSIRVPHSGQGTVYVTADGKIVALAKICAGEVRPVRVFNF